MTASCVDAHALSWLPRGRVLKYASLSSRVTLATAPTTRICRSSVGQKKTMHARGFSMSSRAFWLS
jgi:hypothetical protein